MQDRTYSTEGIILARRNFGEADRIVAIFSKAYGKISAIAKGVRRPTSRKRGSLELFNKVHLLLAKGKSMDIITDVETKETYQGWRKDLTKVAVAYHFCEVVNKLTAEHQEHKEIFDLLTDSFSELTKISQDGLRAFVQSFKVKVLEELGFLERGKSPPARLDAYIEELANSKLRARSFLKTLG
ncbi:DNA repair protein RecO [Candidatus Woesebacteria bacterium]|nr:DNA repair protein RecO [Candidatus Woesebacteria bacterium]|tara:strand:- start:352 stop:903 length:552 start_codon:yes stop_codon:yes gene_type:complete